jgi:coenzyme F420-0:L-glutamate ligase/coenzyme F420-1:gamma-L-glutamate ligase
VGFTPLEVFPELWDPHNPALLLVKKVERGFSMFPLHGLPELREGDDLAAMIVERVELRDGDVVVVAQKAISKIEGRVVQLDDVEPSQRALEIAGSEGDPQRVEWILRESQRVVRVRQPLVIAQTKHGFICASAGVDQSNTPAEGTLVLLPVDSDASAHRLRDTLRERTGHDVGVLITDSFGRPWRQGTTDVAIGAAGITVLHELSGERDPIGYELKATVIAVADELAGAAQLVSGKLDRNPVLVARGLDIRGEGRATDIPIPPERDLFG